MKKKTIGKFLIFIKNNPEVYKDLLSIALREYKQGKKKYSIWAVINEYRWIKRKSISKSVVKVSNDFTPLLARKMMRDDKRLKGFFETKDLKPDFTEPETSIDIMDED